MRREKEATLVDLEGVVKMPLVGTNALFQITEHQSYSGSTPVNVFWYRTNSAAVVTASVINTAFQTLVSTARRAISNPRWSSLTIEVLQVNSIDNFGEFSSYGAGTYSTGTTEDAASMLAAPIRLFRSNLETRSGWKRCAGLSEGMLEGNTLTAAYLALVQTYADLLDNVLSAGGESHTPVIIRKTRDPITKVLLPAIDWIYNPIGSAVALDRVSTQNSRKFYS